MNITLTEEHIVKGKPKSFCECPIALAIKDSDEFKVWLKENESYKEFIIVISTEDFNLVDPNTHVSKVYASFPTFVTEFINRFDNGDILLVTDKKPKGFDFELNLNLNLKFIYI